MARTWITIGEVARRSGAAASALRFYEEQGLVASTRTAGGQRQFPKEVLRRIAFIRAAQTVGLSLEQIKAALATLPEQRTPNKADWERLSQSWRGLLDERIQALVALRDQLTSCIGCGCLSLRSCALYNPGDAARRRGSGARYLLGDRAADVVASRSAGPLAAGVASASSAATPPAAAETPAPRARARRGT